MWHGLGFVGMVAGNAISGLVDVINANKERAYRLNMMDKAADLAIKLGGMVSVTILGGKGLDAFMHKK